MSIVGMVDNKVALEKRKAQPDQDPESPPQGAIPGVQANVLNQLVAYIPTEIITLWVALIAILNDPSTDLGQDICHADWSTHWILAAVFAGLAAALTLGLAYRKFKDTDGVSFKWPVFQMVAAPLAFLAWAVALPEGPLRSACWYTEEAGAFIVTVATVALTTIGYILGENKRFEKA
jgi:hypothetical protein